MAELQFNSRFQNKKDSLTNWKNSGFNNGTYTLKDGEIAFVVVEAKRSSDPTVQTPVPTLMYKVGNGVDTFDALPWGSALAADVYDWAKAETLAYDSLPEELKQAIVDLKEAVGDEGSVAELISKAINDLDVTDAEVENQFITSVSQVDGKIEVKRAQVTIANVSGLQAALDAKVNVSDFNTFKSENTAAIGNAVTGAINGLTSTSTGTGFVSEVTQANGKVTVTKKEIGITDVTDLETSLNSKVNVSEFNTYKEGVQSTLDSLNESASGADEQIEGILEAINGINEALDTKQDTIPENTYDSFGSASAAESAAKSHADEKVAELKETVDSNTDRISDLESEITELEGAMHFVGKSTTDPVEDGVTIDGLTDYVPEAGDVVLYGSQEYIYGKSGSWVLFGDEGSYLTKTDASNTYLTKTDAASTYVKLEDYRIAIESKADKSTVEQIGLLHSQDVEALTKVDEELSGRIDDVETELSTNVVKSVKGANGIKSEATSTGEFTLSLDSSVTFVFNAGSASTVVD